VVIVIVSLVREIMNMFKNVTKTHICQQMNEFLSSYPLSVPVPFIPHYAQILFLTISIPQAASSCFFLSLDDAPWILELRSPMGSDKGKSTDRRSWENRRYHPGTTIANITAPAA
jgi:hypothetical protein